VRAPLRQARQDLQGQLLPDLKELHSRVRAQHGLCLQGMKQEIEIKGLELTKLEESLKTERVLLYIAPTSRVSMGTVKNFLIHFAEPKSLSTKFQTRMELKYRQLLHN
jgi:hypothetical protein